MDFKAHYNLFQSCTPCIKWEERVIEKLIDNNFLSSYYHVNGYFILTTTFHWSLKLPHHPSEYYSPYNHQHWSLPQTLQHPGTKLTTSWRQETEDYKVRPFRLKFNWGLMSFDQFQFNWSYPRGFISITSVCIYVGGHELESGQDRPV